MSTFLFINRQHIGLNFTLDITTIKKKLALNTPQDYDNDKTVRAPPGRKRPRELNTGY